MLESPAAAAASSFRTVEDLRGPAGRLEAIYTPGAPHARHAVVLCHPHPLHGGTMHNKVVYHAAKVFRELGLPVLRFNFRGAGLSDGTHDDGQGEQQDVAAACDWLARETALPLVGAGFSFGAHMVFRVGCADERIEALVGLGLPIAAGDRDYHYDFLASCTKPALVVIGAEDEFAPRPRVQAALATARHLDLVWIPEADHFFAGRLALMQQAVRAWLPTHLTLQPVSPGPAGSHPRESSS